MNGDPSKDSDHTIDGENMAVNESDHIFDSVEVNTLAEENNVHDVCIEETGIQIDIEDSNIDEANIHGSSKTNDGNDEQTESRVDDDVEQNDVSQDSFTWSKYSPHLFPNDLPNDSSKMMISEMNNADNLFRQSMTEFLQTDINESLDFSLSAITIQSLEK